jgi:hypothetical protein
MGLRSESDIQAEARVARLDEDMRAVTGAPRRLGPVLLRRIDTSIMARVLHLAISANRTAAAGLAASERVS